MRGRPKKEIDVGTTLQVMELNLSEDIIIEIKEIISKINQNLRKSIKFVDVIKHHKPTRIEDYKYILECIKREYEYQKKNPIHKEFLNTKSNWASRTLSSHKSRGHTINISREELIEFLENKTKCELCGRELNWESNKKKIRQDSPTLDRMNNENVIDIDNIMILCHRCNASKQDRTLKEFVDYCKEISKIHPDFLHNSIRIRSTSIG